MKLTFDKWDAPCASYLVNAMFDHEKNLAEAVENLKGTEFDTIVVTGVSGLVFGVPLAQKMNKHIAIVRKEQDGTHSHKSIEATVKRDELGRWLFVDDLIDTGKTEKRVKAKIKEHTDGVAVYIGSYLFENHNLRIEPKFRPKKVKKMVVA